MSTLKRYLTPFLPQYLVGPVAALFLILITGAGCGGETRFGDISIGRSLGKDGLITDASVDFLFRKFTRGGTSGDLFNYLYFEGDTLCFSFSAPRGIERDSVSVHLINPANGGRFRPERVDYHQDRIAGFSLVGTVMEQFFSGDIQSPAPADNYCCRKIPVKVVYEAVSNGTIVTGTKDGFFTIEYR